MKKVIKEEHVTSTNDIFFRQDSALPEDYLLNLVLALVGILLVLYFFLKFFKDRLIQYFTNTPSVNENENQDVINVISKSKISLKTTVYIVSVRKKLFILTENDRHTQISPIDNDRDISSAVINE